jgi:hypothetical protein
LKSQLLLGIEGRRKQGVSRRKRSIARSNGFQLGDGILLRGRLFLSSLRMAARLVKNKRGVVWRSM